MLDFLKKVIATISGYRKQLLQKKPNQKHEWKEETFHSLFLFHKSTRSVHIVVGVLDNQAFNTQFTPEE